MASSIRPDWQIPAACLGVLFDGKDEAARGRSVVRQGLECGDGVGRNRRFSGLEPRFYSLFRQSGDCASLRPRTPSRFAQLGDAMLLVLHRKVAAEPPNLGRGWVKPRKHTWVMT